MKLDAVHGHRDNWLIRPSGTPDLMMYSDRTCLVDVAQKYAAEDRPVRIRISGHHHDFDGKVSVSGLCVVCQGSTSILVFSLVPVTVCRLFKQRGFKFVGATICYAFMQAVSMVNDHLVDCFRHAELQS
ncbi:unnamed protein product [marine sediment metagenome]|uniref:DNA-3-methyladenine glycosylase I n=1 Tax=marine sediment metagenome TaxID=412755 RepID=X0RK87_9ZZZZ